LAGTAQTVSATRDCLLVVQKGDHSLGYYAVASGEELDRVALDPFPHEFALSKDQRRAYICHFGLALAEDEGPGGNTVSVVNVPTGQRVDTFDCGDFRRPHGIDVDGSGRVLVLSEMRGVLLRFDESRRVSDLVVATGGEGSHFVTVTSDGRRAFCSNMVSGTVSVIDTVAAIVESIAAVGERPEGSVLSHDEGRLFVANRESSQISVIDTESLQCLAPIRTRQGPVRITLDRRGRLLVALYHGRGMVMVDPDTGEELGFAPLGNKAISISFDDPTRAAYLSTLGNEVCQVDLDTMSLRQRIHTRADPDPTAVVRLGA